MMEKIIQAVVEFLLQPFIFIMGGDCWLRDLYYGTYQLEGRQIFAILVLLLAIELTRTGILYTKDDLEGEPNIYVRAHIRACLGKRGLYKRALKKELRLLEEADAEGGEDNDD